MTRGQGAPRGATGPRRRRLDHIDDIDDWLDAVGDELAQELDLIDEAPPPAGKVGEQEAKEMDADMREPGPDFTKKRLAPGEWAVWLFVAGCVVAKIIVMIVRG